ncbi:mannose-6-phosphate isomerase [Piedraia hortae CBS 480.64]|uniref:Mannose-6-phosphate isomerase n=1 Tax=Piedraia hortae CBS 480.64 TaxID=1314780 RepID=A0A6A7BRD1_9PEZI|nr:mannose-6-phosphate isomerase [Piedraia hortae CBS 480.64]
MQIPLLRLQCGCNSYEWGKKGHNSAAARFAAATSEFCIKSDQPYAELWMGTHPSNPSKDVATNRTLLDLVRDNKMLLSPEVADKYGNKLPFLFKVLSMRTALSIQAHPNKTLAEKLHARDPKHYPDDNHKPEMTIAIAPFQGLCGFRPLSEIVHFLKSVPSLRQLVGEEKSDALAKAVQQDVDTKGALKQAFAALMRSPPQEVEGAAAELVQQAKDEGKRFANGGVEATSGEELASLILRLNQQFPNDIGLFVVFFLNYVKLSPGEAMFLRADDIHAYISGDIIECMAASDNVVRAGFTPKFKDVDTLVDMLTYDYAPIAEQKMTPTSYKECRLKDGQATLYDPPIEEFSVVHVLLNSSEAEITFAPIDGPAVIICTKGKGKISVGPKTEPFEEGFVYFVGSTAELKIECTGEQLEAFRAFCVI